MSTQPKQEIITFSPDQQKHWQRFAQNHKLEKCDDCHAIHIVCELE